MSKTAVEKRAVTSREQAVKILAEEVMGWPIKGAGELWAYRFPCLLVYRDGRILLFRRNGNEVGRVWNPFSDWNALRECEEAMDQDPLSQYCGKLILEYCMEYGSTSSMVSGCWAGVYMPAEQRIRAMLQALGYEVRWK